MKAMILAAGRGERMRPLTDHTPKPLLTVAGKPLIVYHIERLVSAGFTEIVINVAHLGTQIINSLSDGKQFGARIHFSEEPYCLETGGGIWKALPLLTNNAKDEAFMVINGDIWCDYPVLNLPKKISHLAHLVLVNNSSHHSQGDFALEKRELGSYPLLRNSGDECLTFSGISVINPRIFNFFTEDPTQPFSIVPLLRKAAAAGLVTGEHYRGEWADIGTPERLLAVNKRQT